RQQKSDGQKDAVRRERLVAGAALAQLADRLPQVAVARPAAAQRGEARPEPAGGEGGADRRNPHGEILLLQRVTRWKSSRGRRDWKWGSWGAFLASEGSRVTACRSSATESAGRARRARKAARL